jgi:galactose-1-phosphate uridylyltransferase
VLIVSPDHQRHFGRLDNKEVLPAWRLIASRLAQLQLQGWPATLMFTNCGHGTGASQIPRSCSTKPAV